jgi:hypothetical protein
MIGNSNRQTIQHLVAPLTIFNLIFKTNLVVELPIILIKNSGRTNRVVELPIISTKKIQVGQ